MSYNVLCQRVFFVFVSRYFRILLSSFRHELSKILLFGLGDSFWLIERMSDNILRGCIT